MSRIKAHLNIVILSDTDLKEEDYVIGIYNGIKEIDKEADAVIGTVFLDTFRSGIQSAMYLIQNYIKDKEGLTKEEIERYIKQLQSY